MKQRAWLFGVLGALSMWSCDTASSIDPPENSFFVKFYGDNGNQEGVDAVLNVDGTITLLGTNEVGGIKQLYLVNIEQNGNVIWENTIATPTAAKAKDIELTNDGRLAIVADLTNTPGEHDILVITLTLTGDIINQSVTGFNNGVSNTDETAHTVTHIANGFLVAGSTNNLDIKPIGTGPFNGGDTRDALHLRYFDDLTLYPTTGPNVWRRAFGPGTFDEGVRIVQTFDDPDKLPPEDPSQYLVFGYSDAQIDKNFYYEVLGATGEVTINRIYAVNPANPADEILTDVVSAAPAGNGYLMAGVSKMQSSTNIFISKIRQFPNPLRPIDFQTFQNSSYEFSKPMAINLGEFVTDNVSVFPSASSGFLLLANDKSGPVQNFSLHKVDIQGNQVWGPIIFGGEMDDEIGAVLEMPDGSIGIIGTFAIGQDGEKKMTFIKVNKEGKFSK